MALSSLYKYINYKNKHLRKINIKLKYYQSRLNKIKSKLYQNQNITFDIILV